jgi:GABA permease
VVLVKRYLVVANQTLGAEPLAIRLRELARQGSASFFLVVPATPPRDHLWTEGEARATAKASLDTAMARFSGLEAELEGEVGDGNPMLAIGDAIRDHGPFEEIVISTFPKGISKWLKVDLPHRAQAAYGIPVTHVVGEPEPAVSGRQARKH